MSKPLSTKHRNHAIHQFGFFDLGIALVILAVSGASVYAVESHHPSTENPQQVAAKPVQEAAE